MPDWVSPCSSCKQSANGYRAIGGSGPQPSSILCIGERPGDTENRNGMVFIGKTGEEFDNLYLPLAGLDRSDIRVCNTVLCGADNNKAPTDKEIRECSAHHLPGEIRKTQPLVIFLMGASACSLCPGIQLDRMHGIPQHTKKVGEVHGWSGVVVPMYHPSMGLHESRWMQMIMEDWKSYGLREELPWDPPPQPVDYVTGQHARLQWLFKPLTYVAVDTESHGPEPWSVQISTYKGEGGLIRTTDVEGMNFLRAFIPDKDVILHNASYDLEVLRKLGIRVTRFRDTMQEAFHLGNLPQGLKALSYRLFRHTMTSYEEVVWPASISALQEWMYEAVQIAELDLSHVERKQLKTKVKETVKPSGLETLLRRLLRMTDSASDYSPWGTHKEPRLDAFWSDPLNEYAVSHVEARIGHYPILGIGNCSMEEAVRYAVGDADWTGRVAVELERRRKEAFPINEVDIDL